MSEIEQLKAAHRAAAKTKATTAKAAKAAKPEPVPVAFSEVDVKRILDRARVRAQSDMVVDRITAKRILAALAGSVQLVQWTIVCQRLEDYADGACDFPKDEVTALKTIDELARQHVSFDESKTDTTAEGIDKIDVLIALEEWRLPI